MRVEFDSVLGKDKGTLVNRLRNRGLDENEAISIVEILFNTASRQKEKADIRAQLLALKQVVADGDATYASTDDISAYYKELKAKIKHLESQR